LANRTTDPGSESEWLTRKRRIDPLLDAAGWPRRKAKASPAFRTEEEETAHGPAETEDLPSGPTGTLHEIVEAIWENRDTAYNVGCLRKHLQRIDKDLSGEAREALAAYVPDGDLAR
jgi:hypothetical protein